MSHAETGAAPTLNNAPAPTASIWPAIAAGALFTAAALAIMYFGHLHEDAYILFQYSANLAAGNGIAFDLASGHAEGATDFLWMTALALLAYLKVLPGVGAAILNGVGLAALSHIIIRLRGRVDLVSLLAIAMIALSGGTAASLGGFSALAYGGFFAVLLYNALQRNYTSAVILGMLLALFRPDGVLLAAGTVIAMFIHADAAGRRTLVKAAAGATIAGLLYFWWRMDYFGLPLPLPLIVKSQGGSVGGSIKESLSAINLFVLLLVPILVYAYRHTITLLSKREYAVLLAGPGILLFALSFAHQSQNIGNRFQFPIIVALVLCYLLMMRSIGERSRAPLTALTGAIAIWCIVSGSNTVHVTTNSLASDVYINSFPQLLRENGPRIDNIAITEAGRFPYWYNARQMTDLVGLNSAIAAISGPAQALEESKPSLIFVHHAKQYDTSGLTQDQRIHVTDAKNLDVIKPYTGEKAVIAAPHAALAYAKKNDYVAVLVKYGPADTLFRHVYFLDRSVDIERFLNVLNDSHNTRINYFQSEAMKQQ